MAARLGVHAAASKIPDGERYRPKWLMALEMIDGPVCARGPASAPRPTRPAASKAAPVQWAPGRDEHTGYWLSGLPTGTVLIDLVRLAQTAGVLNTTTAD